MLRAMLLAVSLLATSYLGAEEQWTSIPKPAAMPESTHSGTASLNGISMYYASYGNAEGVPLLLIHGGLAHERLHRHRSRFTRSWPFHQQRQRLLLRSYGA